MANVKYYFKSEPNGLLFARNALGVARVGPAPATLQVTKRPTEKCVS